MVYYWRKKLEFQTRKPYLHKNKIMNFAQSSVSCNFIFHDFRESWIEKRQEKLLKNVEKRMKLEKKSKTRKNWKIEINGRRNWKIVK